MAVIITTNAYLNVSSLDERGDFNRKSLFLHAYSNYRRVVHLNSKRSRTKVILCLNMNTKEPSSGDGVLSREFEFKPSFDQYLQMMESVKSERSRKKFDRLLKDKVDDNDGGDRVSADSQAHNGSSSRNLELDRDVKRVESDRIGELSVAVSKDESLRRRKVVVDNRSSDTSKRKGRSSKNEELGLAVVKSESQNQRIASKRNDFGGGKLTRSSRRVATRDDDSEVHMEIPAFKFSDESSEVVDKPPASRMEMDDRIEKLAKGLNGADINLPEWLFSKAMRSARIRYSDHTITRLIQILGKLGNWRRVLQVIEWLQRQERFKSNKLRIVYTTALSVLGKSRRPVEALNVFHAMQQQMSSYPDMVAYRSIAVTLGQAGHIKELFDVIDTMRSPPKKKFRTLLGKWDPRLEPDVVVYNAVLNACVQRKQWEGAFWVLQQLRQQGQKPSAATYGLVMEVMFSCGKYNLVHEFFRKIQKSSIPNALAYRVLVNTLWKEGKTNEAEQAVEEMERRGIVGSAALYYDLARCLCSAGRCDEGLKLIKKICRVANKPLVVTYTGLIQACLDSGNVQSASYIFNRMEEVCSPNLVCCNIMVKAYLQHGVFEEARELFQKMSEDGQRIETRSDYKSRVLPDTYTFNTMLDSCAEERKWDDFEYVYTQMLRQGYHFNAKRHLRMVLEATRAGKEEVLETTWNHLRRGNWIPPTPLIKERFCKKLEKGDLVSAISSVADIENEVGEIELRSFSKNAWLKLLKANESRFGKDSVLRLMEDVKKLVARRSESSGSVLESLLSSCKEFLTNRT
ncbi:PREDICTED: pentatricopeptide repeat-containing protein At1g30610, chloroplastic isoform X2 [Tarenaya hassleriana]|uniref:pentatricopeptide repeat-containing protein At1g30610, chloroplastic isoform X2 n=1 Tax=Tarenaya hassleriana TaxID=28532 RepID=UPI00053C98CC|nr:PREDICTED: pentatricopeptide repeat-containing protein At1g30610, chloroplastic isoform X2 [Tarenaya hassleriana]